MRDRFHHLTAATRKHDPVGMINRFQYFAANTTARHGQLQKQGKSATDPIVVNQYNKFVF